MGGTMLLAVIMALVSPLQEAAPEGASQPVRAPRHWAGVEWSRTPSPVPPGNAKGTLQAEVFCVAGEGHRVTSCRIERQIPSDSGYGRNVLRNLRLARTRGEQIHPGDTITFVIWTCMDTEPGDPCRRVPWPSE